MVFPINDREFSVINQHLAVGSMGSAELVIVITVMDLHVLGP